MLIRPSGKLLATHSESDMGITKLTVEGFRSLKNVVWEPGELNVLIGPNGSGKSNLVRAIQLLAASAQGHLGAYVQGFGGTSALVWDYQAPAISFSIQSSFPLPQPEPSKTVFNYGFTLEWLVGTSRYRVGNEVLGESPSDAVDALSSSSTLIEQHGNVRRILNPNRQMNSIPPEFLSDEETILSLATNPVGVDRSLFLYKSILSAFCVYHDIHLDQYAAIRQPVIARLERRINSDGQNLVNVLHTLYTTHRGFKQSVDEAMRAAFGAEFEELQFPPAADQRVQLHLKWRSLSFARSSAELSDGTLRFLLLIAVLADPLPAPLIAIDEPETGLHPSMLPIVAEYAVDAATRTQLVFTTHSPQFLDAFRDARPTTTIFDLQGGETRMRNLSGDSLDYWLQSYSLGELFQSGELEALE
ncbi:MAG: AAA family ATPase [Planctomycetes bacterium]|nr:AAA family ATPase [Planctomycetota bacterium]